MKEEEEEAWANTKGRGRKPYSETKAASIPNLSNVSFVGLPSLSHPRSLNISWTCFFKEFP